MLCTEVNNKHVQIHLFWTRYPLLFAILVLIVLRIKKRYKEWSKVCTNVMASINWAKINLGETEFGLNCVWAKMRLGKMANWSKLSLGEISIGRNCDRAKQILGEIAIGPNGDWAKFPLGNKLWAISMWATCLGLFVHWAF